MNLKNVKETGTIEIEKEKEIVVDPIDDIVFYPTKENLIKAMKLTENKVKKGERYHSIQELISVNFKLLMEDFLFSLRDGLYAFKKKEQVRMRDLPIFTNVKINGISVGSQVSFTVSFQTTMKKEGLSQSKYLMLGSLVVLFPKDKYEEEPIIGIIENRDTLTKKNQLKIDISFQTDITKISFFQEYIMIESPCYFRSVEPVLKSLQEKEKLPFQDILTKPNKELIIPEYIRKHPSIDITSLLKDKSEKKKINITQNSVRSSILSFRYQMI